MKTIKIALFMLSLFSVGILSAADKIWLTDFDQAKKEAAKRNLPILVEFSGSNWCKWCIRLDQEVFSTKAFKDYAKDNFILLFIDFPTDGSLSQEQMKKNQELADRYQAYTFPTILILDKDGKEMARGGYMPGGSEAYINYLKAIKERLK